MGNLSVKADIHISTETDLVSRLQTPLFQSISLVKTLCLKMSYSITVIHIEIYVINVFL